MLGKLWFLPAKFPPKPWTSLYFHNIFLLLSEFIIIKAFTLLPQCTIESTDSVKMKHIMQMVETVHYSYILVLVHIVSPFVMTEYGNHSSSTALIFWKFHFKMLKINGKFYIKFHFIPVIYIKICRKKYMKIPFENAKFCAKKGKTQ